MALKLVACAAAAVAVVLALATAAAAAAEDCGVCSKKCVDKCHIEAPTICENICSFIPQFCDTCEALYWKKCATACYAAECKVAETATQCPLMTTLCNVCRETCAAPCDDVDQLVLCAGDCAGDASSPECASCKDRATDNCAAACQADICVLLLSCPPV